MAYLDLSVPGQAAALFAPDLAETRFTRREWTTIALAHFDKPDSLAAPGSVRRLIETLFNVRRPNAMADTRLEALRHSVVMLRAGRNRAEVRNHFLDAGYSAGQFETLSGHVAQD